MSQNPYEAPRFDAASAPEGTSDDGTVYYQTDTRKLRYAEYWRMARNPFEFLIASMLKTLRIRLPMAFAFAGPGGARRIDPSTVSPEARQEIARIAEPLTGLGMHYLFSYTLQSVGAVESAAACFLSADGEIVAQVIFVRTWTKLASDRKTQFALISQLADGRLLLTSGAKQELDGPKDVYLAESLPGRSPAEVWERHRARLAEQRQSAIMFRDEREVGLLLKQNETRVAEFNIGRGVWMPITPADVERLRQAATQTAPPAVTRSTAFQGVELACWVALCLMLFLSSDGLIGPGPGLRGILFRASVIGGSLLLIGLIWLYRFLENRRRSAEQAGRG